MNFNSGFTKILVEVGAGIFSGVFMETLLEILSFVIELPFHSLFLIINTLFPHPSDWKDFVSWYWPSVILKLGIWALLCWLFGRIGKSYFRLGSIHIIVAGVIGFYTLVYLTLYEVSNYVIYSEDWQWGYFYQIQPFLATLPMPPFLRFLLWIGVLKNSS